MQGALHHQNPGGIAHGSFCQDRFGNRVAEAVAKIAQIHAGGKGKGRAGTINDLGKPQQHNLPPSQSRANVLYRLFLHLSNIIFNIFLRNAEFRGSLPHRGPFYLPERTHTMETNHGRIAPAEGGGWLWKQFIRIFQDFIRH